jgi:protein-disulfide isomerase
LRAQYFYGGDSVNKLSVPVNAKDHSLGPEDAPSTIVEYGRYDCPHCKQALITLGIVRKRFDRPLRLVYRHFPLMTPNSQSQGAAEAAEAAGRQGKFWEMHAHLLEHQHALDDAGFLASAVLIGLDTSRFAADLESGVDAENVLSQFRSGRESGVRSTPTFFVNGIRHDGDWDVDTLLAVLCASLK